MKRQAYYILDPDDAIQPGDRVNQGTIYLRPVPDAVTLDDGWKKHDGGECPVHGSQLVDIKFRHGDIVPSEKAETWDWSVDDKKPYPNDIIAYRVVKPAPKQPLGPDDGWIPWSGGNCPVDYGTLVQVKFSNGASTHNPTPARFMDWSSGGIISFYKVIEPAPKQPLTCDDVPPGSVFRRSAPDGHPSDIVYLIPTGVFQDSVQFFVNEKPCVYTWESLSRLPQWQIKRSGEDWKPCCK